MLKVDQAWGMVQFSAVAHNIHAAYYGPFETSGHPEDKWGWAVQGALQIKNIPWGVGDTFNIQAVYTDGASRYNFQNLAPQGFVMFGGTSAPGAYQSVGIAAVADGVFGNVGGIGTGIDTVQTWGLRGAYNHNWDPYWSSSLFGAYAQVNYQNAGALSICTNFAANAVTRGVTAVGGGVCNPDFNVGQIGVVTRWTPVKGLTFSGKSSGPNSTRSLRED